MTTFSAIPSARAEVLRWFAPKNAGEYIASDPEEREPIEELEHMIAKPETSTVDIKVNYVADEPYWREIGENFSMSFGETIYDGEYISILMDFDGLSGYAVAENMAACEIPAGTGVPLSRDSASAQAKASKSRTLSRPAREAYTSAQNL